jgi:hypothetical protein
MFVIAPAHLGISLAPGPDSTYSLSMSRQRSAFLNVKRGDHFLQADVPVRIPVHQRLSSGCPRHVIWHALEDPPPHKSIGAFGVSIFIATPSATS